MTNQKPVLSTQTKNVSILAQLFKQLRLVWLLFRDNRVSLWTKSILPILLLYIVSPIDILPDVLIGVGQLDDLGVMLLGIALFVKLCPPDIVDYYRKQIDYESSGEVIEAAYRKANGD